MNTLTSNYLSEAACARSASALAFDASEARKAWSEQRISNDRDDLTITLPKGVEKLKIHGKKIIADLLAN